MSPGDAVRWLMNTRLAGAGLAEVRAFYRKSSGWERRAIEAAAPGLLDDPTERAELLARFRARADAERGELTKRSDLIVRGREIIAKLDPIALAHDLSVRYGVK